MKNLIEKLVGGKLYATANNINGRKSVGCEDLSHFNHWRKDFNDGMDRSTN